MNKKQIKIETNTDRYYQAQDIITSNIILLLILFFTIGLSSQQVDCNHTQLTTINQVTK